jgi:hypothetical protein
MPICIPNPPKFYAQQSVAWDGSSICSTLYVLFFKETDRDRQFWDNSTKGPQCYSALTHLNRPPRYGSFLRSISLLVSSRGQNCSGPRWFDIAPDSAWFRVKRDIARAGGWPEELLEEDILMNDYLASKKLKAVKWNVSSSWPGFLLADCFIVG